MKTMPIVGMYAFRNIEKFEAQSSAQQPWEVCNLP